jgi:serine/threonine protein kinase
MTVPADLRHLLLQLACESIAGAIPGCAEALTVQLHKRSSPGAGLAPGHRAIDLFGPLIVARWLAWLEEQTSEVRAQALQQLACLVPTATQQVVRELIERTFRAASDEDRKVAVSYLTAIPVTAREALDAGPGSDRSPEPREPLGEGSLLRLLPMNAPPFPVGSDLPGSPYRLDELLGSGGFGVVYRASNRFEQNTPPRAIKLCINPEMLESLKRERELLDRLMSAGNEAQWSDRIVKLYGHNLDAPFPFLVYEYVSGGNLLTRLALLRKQGKGNLLPQQVLGLIRRICEALAFAHDQGLVHRDIKPSNILVSGNTIKLADFGIGGVVADFVARAESVDGAHRSASERCSVFRGAGTPLYMSPEQRRREPPHPRQDVYSLGVMWYQFLIGDHTRELAPGWEDELADEFDVPQRQIDLIGQCVGYVKKRPASARELLALLPPPGALQAPAIRAEQVGEPRFLTGHEGTVASLAFSADARRLLSGGSDGTARLWDVESGKQIACFRPNARSILSVALAPDGRRALFGCDSHQAWLWDLSRQSEQSCFAGHTLPITCVAFSPDGRRALTGSQDRTIRLWHVGAGRELLRIDEHRKRISGLTFTPDGLCILSGSEDGTLALWDSETGWESRLFSMQGDWLLSLAIAPDGRTAACGGKERLGLWDLETGQQVGTFEGHTLPVMGVSFLPNGRWLLSGSLDRSVRLWNVATRRELHSFEGAPGGITAVVASPDGRFAACAGRDSAIRLWALPEG